MDIQQALIALKEGNTLTHSSFMSYESIKQEGENIVDELGYKTNCAQWWAYRTTPMFSINWGIKS